MEKNVKKSATLPIKASRVELVTDKNREQEIKELIKKLKK